MFELKCPACGKNEYDVIERLSGAGYEQKVYICKACDSDFDLSDLISCKDCPASGNVCESGPDGACIEFHKSFDRIGCEWPDPCFYCGKYPLFYDGKIHCECEPPHDLNFTVYANNILDAVRRWNECMKYAKSVYKPENKKEDKNEK
jgi:hypothetical protein